MKLLIDIPEHIYEHAKETTEDSRDEFDAMRAIANGTQQESRSEIPNTCGDAISRDKAIVQLSHLLSDWDDDWNVGIRMCIETIKALSSVTPQQRTGRWIEVIDESDSLGKKTWHHECSICGSDKSGWGTYKHCPDCGTKMEVEE